MSDWDRTDPLQRWEHRRTGLYERGEQLRAYDFHSYRRNVLEAAESGSLSAAQAAWIARDLILNAGERGGAEAVGIDLLHTLRDVAGGPSVLGRPKELDPDWRIALYRGGRSAQAASWTSSQMVAATYAASDWRGLESRSRRPVWALLAEPADVLAVVPVAYDDGPAEFVLDPARITSDRVDEVPDADQLRTVPRIRGQVNWERARGR